MCIVPIPNSHSHAHTHTHTHMQENIKITGASVFVDPYEEVDTKAGRLLVTKYSFTSRNMGKYVQYSCDLGVSVS